MGTRRRGLFLAVALATAAPVVHATASAPAADRPAGLVHLVDTRSGSLGAGFVTVGAGVPFGMVTPGPSTTTPAGDDPVDYTGYAYQDPELRGFSLIHFSGAGVHMGGELPFMPTTGAVTSDDPGSWATPYSHASETAQPGYYATTLPRSGIGVELTSTTRTAVERYTFPATTKANLLLDVTRDDDSNQSGGIGTQRGATRILDNRTVTGDVVVPGSGDVSIYFTARFDRPFVAHGTWTKADGLKAGGSRAIGQGAGGWVSFDTTRDRTVGARIGVSYTSSREATANLEREAPDGTTFDAVRRTAQRAWNDRLASVRVQGGAPGQLRSFYTCLYHALLMPTTFDDADRRYLGFDGTVHRVARGHHHYTDLSLWDTYRTQTPLLSLVAPSVAHDLGVSLLADTAQNHGVIPKWVRANRDYSIMGGDSGTATLATLVADGALRGADARRAYADLLRQATTLPAVAPRSGLADYLDRGYIPLQVSDRGAAVTLEYGIDDASIAALAQRFGDAPNARRFKARAGYWRNLLDPSTHFLRPRNADGTWAKPTSLGAARVWNPMFSDGWQEGTGWQYLWLVPQDVRGLTAALGRQTTLSRLDRFFSAAIDNQVAPVVPTAQTQGSLFGAYYVGDQYTPANETDLQAPWLYDWLGEPWRTQQIVHAETRAFNASPYGLPGNDDAGTMSADYVLSTIGLYQAQPGVDAWELSSPMFSRVAIGHRLTITAPDAGPTKEYVATGALSGRPVRQTWLRTRDLSSGKHLAFTMSTTPTSWASDSAAAPPSLSKR